MSKLAIFGASGHGKVVADIALCTGWDEIFFYDDAWPDKERLEGWNVYGGFDALLNAVNLYDGAVVAIGNNDIREKGEYQLTNALESLKQDGAQFKPGTVKFAPRPVTVASVVSMVQGSH